MQFQCQWLKVQWYNSESEFLIGGMLELLLGKVGSSGVEVWDRLECWHGLVVKKRLTAALQLAPHNAS